MTYREFKTLVSSVSQEQFQTDQSHPILFGIERLQFEKLKLEKLVEAGNQVDCKTAQRRVQAWEREMARLDAKRKYMEDQYKTVFRGKAVFPGKESTRESRLAIS